VDERTVEFTLPQRYAPAESIFSFPVAPRHKLEGPYKAGTFNSAWNTTTPVSELASSGPFVITEHVPGQRFVFRRNPRFWGRGKDGTRQPLPYLDRIVFPIVSDLNAQALKFRAGQTDAMDVPAAEYAAVKRGEAGGDYHVYARGLSWSWLYLGLNQNREARLDPRLLALFNDVRFRRAVAHACDRERLCRDVFAGLARPVYGPVTPANTLYHNPRVPRYEYDPSRSRALLREIGLKDADGDGIVEANGANVRFNLLTSASNPANIAVATILSEDLKKIGLGVRFTAIDFNELLRRTNAPPFEWEGRPARPGREPGAQRRQRDVALERALPQVVAAAEASGDALGGGDRHPVRPRRAGAGPGPAQADLRPVAADRRRAAAADLPDRGRAGVGGADALPQHQAGVARRDHLER
jgi:peptide/nickel transport system substrate-binding protein